MAGSADYESVLGIAPLTEALRITTSGIPDPTPPEFNVVKPANRIIGDRARWVQIQGARTTAPLAAYGSPGKRVPLQPIATVPVRMFYFGMEFLINANLLAKLMAFMNPQGGAYYQDEGVDFLAYNLQELGKRMANSRIVAKISMILNGAVYWDSQGNLLPSSSGASFTYTSNVPATHQNGLNGIISASWALTNTDIFAQIRQLQVQSVQDTGLRQEHAMYGINIPTYFYENSVLIPYFARNPNFRDTLVDTGDIPPMFGGIKKWTNMSTSFFQDQNGNNQLLWGGDDVVFTPDVAQMDKMDWWAMYEGSAAVLRGFDVYADAMGALSNCKQEFGMSAFAVPTLSVPIGIYVYSQDTFLPAIKNPLAWYSALSTY